MDPAVPCSLLRRETPWKPRQEGDCRRMHEARPTEASPPICLIPPKLLDQTDLSEAVGSHFLLPPRIKRRSNYVTWPGCSRVTRWLHLLSRQLPQQARRLWRHEEPNHQEPHLPGPGTHLPEWQWPNCWDRQALPQGFVHRKKGNAWHQDIQGSARNNITIFQRQLRTLDRTARNRLQKAGMRPSARAGL